MKKIFVLLVALVACVPAWSQLLWRVEGNGLDKPSYIVGTHHFAPIAMIDSIKGLRQAIKDVDAVYGEIHMDSLVSASAQQLMMTAMMAPADSTLDKLLTSEEFAIVDGVVGKYMGVMGVELKQLVSLKPSALATQLQAFQAQKHFPTFDANAQIDRVVQSMGRDAGKELGGFEAVIDQVEVLFGAPLTEQKESLVEMCRYDSEYEEVVEQLSRTYEAQDIDTMFNLLVNPEKGAKPTAEELDRLVWNRNRNWVAQLKVLMPARSVLSCVGAGHLPGEQGLIALLRNAGYTVTPVK